MPKTILPAECYTHAKWLDFETEKIFKKMWIFACLTQQLQNDNDFVTCELVGVTVLLQKLEGKIKAFRNSCPHKGMPVQTEDCGNRKLLCPYHGWSFDCNGKVRGIPNASLYRFSTQEKQNLTLEEYPTAIIGNFVFIYLNKIPSHPIKDQFKPDLIKLLEDASKYFSSDFSYTRFECKYNWKLNFENVTDFNHIQFVHPKSFAPLIEFGKEGCYGEKFPQGSKIFPPDYVKENSAAPTQPTLQDISFWGRAPLPYKERWYSKQLDACDIGGHFACHLFPNINFGSIHGENFFLQQYNPIAPDLFEYRSWVFTAKVKNERRLPHLLWGIHHAEKNVINEDKVLLEKMQRSLLASKYVGYIGAHETPLTLIGQWYMEKFNAASQ